MAEPFIADLVRKRDAAGAQMRALVASAEAQTRDLTANERRSFDSYNREFDRYQAELARVTEVRSKLGPDHDLLAGAVGRASATRRDDAAIALVRRAIETRTSGVWDFPTSPSIWESRAMSGQSGTAFVSDFSDQLVVYQRTLSPLTRPDVVRVVARSNVRPFVQPRITSDAAAGGTATAEAGALSLLDPTLSAVTITPSKYGAITKLSYELFVDSQIDLPSWIQDTTARAIGIAVGTAFSATLVAGISNGGTASGTASYGASANFFGWGDLGTLYTSVPSTARANGTWLVSTTAYSHLLQLRDNNNSPVVLFTQAGQPTVMGRPVLEDPGLQALGSASKSVIFGDLHNAFTAVTLDTIRMDVSDQAYYGTDEIGVRVIEHWGGAVIDSTAAAYLVSSNT